MMNHRPAAVIFGLSLVALLGFANSQPKDAVMSKDSLLACKLAAPELAQRRAELEAEVFNAILETRELEDGYGFRFPETTSGFRSSTSSFSSSGNAVPSSASNSSSSPSTARSGSTCVADPR